MYCNHCGAAAVGRYCSCCGRRLLSDIEHFRRAERKLVKEFVHQAYLDGGKDMACHHLANACWLASECKYGGHQVLGKLGEPYLAPDAYERLALVKAHAAALYERLKAESF